MSWWYLYCEKCQWRGELNTAYPPGCPDCRNPELMLERGEDGEEPTHRSHGGQDTYKGCLIDFEPIMPT